MSHLKLDRYDFPIANCVNLSHLKSEVDSIVWNCFFVRVLYDFLSIEPEIEIVVNPYMVALTTLASTSLTCMLTNIARRRRGTCMLSVLG